MKIRIGFVSNSSSSSFVSVIEEEAYKEALKNTDAYTRAIMKLVGAEKDKFLGNKVVVIGTFSDAGGGGTFEYIEDKLDYDGDVPKSKDEPEDDMYPSEAFDLFIESIPDDKILTSAVRRSQ